MLFFIELYWTYSFTVVLFAGFWACYGFHFRQQDCIRNENRSWFADRSNRLHCNSWCIAKLWFNKGYGIWLSNFFFWILNASFNLLFNYDLCFIWGYWNIWWAIFLLSYIGGIKHFKVNTWSSYSLHFYLTFWCFSH